MRKIFIDRGLKELNSIDNPNKTNKDRLIAHLSRISEVLNFYLIQNDFISSKRIRLMRTKKLKKALSSRTSDAVTVTEKEILGSNIVLLQRMLAFQRL
jgi:quinolinate synthase